MSHKITSNRAASAAARVLRDPRSTKAERSRRERPLPAGAPESPPVEVAAGPERHRHHRGPFDRARVVTRRASTYSWVCRRARRWAAIVVML